MEVSVDEDATENVLGEDSAAEMLTDPPAQMSRTAFPIKPSSGASTRSLLDVSQIDTNLLPLGYISLGGSMPATPASQQMPAGASASFLHIPRENAARRALNFGDAVVVKTTAVDTNTVTKSCLKRSLHDGSPQKPTGVSFSAPERRDDDEQLLTAGQPAFERQLMAAFADLRRHFDRYARMSDLSMEFDSSSQQQRTAAEGVRSFGSSGGDGSLSSAFLRQLSAEELTQVLESETLKRRHCQRLVDMLQRKVLALEERLCVGETVLRAEREAIETMEQLATSACADFASVERRRLTACRSALQANVDLKERLAVSEASVETTTRRLDDLDRQLTIAQTSLQTERSRADTLHFQNDALRAQVDTGVRQRQDLELQLMTLERERVDWRQKGEELTSQLLAADELLKRALNETENIKSDRQQEQKASRHLLQQMEGQYQMKLTSLRTELTSKSDAKTRLLERARTTEVDQLAVTHEARLKAERTKRETAEGERDQLRSRLTLLEENIGHLERQMWQDVQQRVAEQYRLFMHQLPFGGAVCHPRQPPSEVPPDAGSAIAGGSGASNMMDDFLQDLTQSKPITTPQHTYRAPLSASVLNEQKSYPSQKTGDDVQRRAQQLQAYLKQMVPTRESTIRQHNRSAEQKRPNKN